ncbi:hypothetical protein V1525DRAFT_31625 [Lipomyces kononenkoae]|uniref:Uncharacterized protein n=1 Tax=Lipomyces kononenkoae TaxID=34357 RepID=A0ACC3STA2_LIPKO
MSVTTDAHAFASQVAVALSLLLYPVLFWVLTSYINPPSRFVKSHEAISALHATLVCVLATFELCRRYGDWAPTSLSKSHEYDAVNRGVSDGLGIITSRSVVGNSIAALEMGYLVQDAVLLIVSGRLWSRSSSENGRNLVKDIPWKAIGWHHVIIASALGVLLRYIAQGREKGIFVILILMLMNASY